MASSSEEPNPSATSSAVEEGAAAHPTQISSSQQEICAHCSKTPGESLSSPFRQCSKCHSIPYCSKDCQKAHFKTHKKVCASLAQEYTKTHEPKMASRAPARGGERDRGLQKWQVRIRATISKVVCDADSIQFDT
ncbi:hypothetical protein BKA66DRAFT_584212 [Pyrenochaeta sp. MPI-SDFR-AT-0127]|nr:hypothetical protein BKA66DRAFT_584212 [Pyrenochaeta sp. MPI-SDFR-AT-0127]